MKFLHTINTLSIRTYGEIDRTGNLSLLKRWFNPFPVEWFGIESEAFFESYRELIGSDLNLNTEAYKIIAYNRIQMLDRILKTMSILMRNQNERAMFSILFKRTNKEYRGNMDFYIEKVKSLTGIVVKDGNDLTILQKEIQRLIDKYIERFKKDTVKPADPADFMDIVLSVFTILEMAYVPEMKLAEFGNMKKLADKKIKQLEKVNNGKH